MNVAELLADLQARQDEATARAAELRARIEELTADPTETEARLADLATARKIIAEVTPAGAESEPPETDTTYQAIAHAFNQHPGRAFRARELHELLGMPTGEASVNITRSRLGRLGRLTRQGFLTQPKRGCYQKRT